MLFFRHLVILMMVFSASICQAAFRSSQDAVNPQDAINPHPQADDIILPMPCGLSMVLRPVNIPSGALIRDKTFSMGINNQLLPDRNLYERQYTGHIAGSFTKENLPADWRSKLEGSSKNDTWYFIGKYEVSNLQWDAVMQAVNSDGTETSASCPVARQGSNQPVTGISWFEAQEFLNKYNAWLIKNNREKLPVFADAKNTAFLRLPTEEEWEYAARGGARVPPEWWEDNDIFPFEKNKSLEDYGVYTKGTALEKPAPIGSRNANPLGIYDTAGNVREMVDGFFRMSIADMRNGNVERRLHGSAGGILAKGGSFRGNEYDVLPGYRDEIPLYTSDGPAKPADLGLRLVIAGLNIPDVPRLKKLLNEEANATKREEKKSIPLQISPKQTPVEVIDAIAENAPETVKSGLKQLRAMLEDKEAAQGSFNARNRENIFRSLVYQAETLRAYALRYAELYKKEQTVKSMLKKQLSVNDKEKAEDLSRGLKNDMEDMLFGMQMVINYYRATLNFIAEESPEEIARLCRQARQEYGTNSVFDEHMRQNIDTLEKFLQIIKSNKSLPTKTIFKDIIPARHYKVLPEKIK